MMIPITGKITTATTFFHSGQYAQLFMASSALSITVPQAAEASSRSKRFASSA
jgi:hypothetical protein